MVGLWIDVRIHTKPAIHDLAHFSCDAVYHFKFLERLAVDGEDTLLNRVAKLLVAFAYSSIDYLLRVEAGLYCAAQLIA